MKNMPNIVQIATKDILYYEESKEEKLLNFCDDHNIDRLPSYNGKYKYIKREDKFQKKEIKEKETLKASKGSLDSQVMEKFSEEEFIFVYRNNELMGIAYFCDYNSGVIYEHLYQRIYELETDIRELLRKENLDSSDMVEFIEQHPIFEKSSKRHDPENIKSHRPFQNSNLSELVNFLHDRSEFSLKIDQSNLTDLRNKVMHEKQFVEHNDHQEDSMDYDPETFKDFRRMVRVLSESESKVRNHIKLKEMD